MSLSTLVYAVTALAALVRANEQPHEWQPATATPGLFDCQTAASSDHQTMQFGFIAPAPQTLCNGDGIAAEVPHVKRQQNGGNNASPTISIPQTAAVGGLSMTQPPITAQATYHKIASGNYVTFGWTFSDVIATPSRLTLQAYCSQNGYTYPVGPTNGIAGDSTQFAWSPFAYEASGNANPLAEASYTLRIFDERGFFAQPTAGRMRPYAGSVFALYRPQTYMALADGWTCAACSAAARATPIHPAVLATAFAMLLGAWTIYSRCVWCSQSVV